MTALAVFQALKRKNWKLATAESCTGGMLAAAVTDIAGSSDVFDRGFVTYSNAAKTEMLDVNTATLAAHGAVSAETAEAMAKGALTHSNADIAIAITGIAGPAGGSAAKSVGLVHFAVALRSGKVVSREKKFANDGRHAIRSAASTFALELLMAELRS